MPKLPWIVLPLLLAAGGCAANRPGFIHWPGVKHPESEADGEMEADGADDDTTEECTPRHNFWRALVPWDQKEDTRTEAERLKEYDDKFRNNG